MRQALAYAGFLVAVAYVYAIANELVNLLQAAGIVLDLASDMLGITVLSWGNCAGGVRTLPSGAD